MLVTIEDIKKWNLCKILIQTGNVINVEIPITEGSEKHLVNIDDGVISALRNCFLPLNINIGFNSDTKKWTIKHDTLVK